MLLLYLTAGVGVQDRDKIQHLDSAVIDKITQRFSIQPPEEAHHDAFNTTDFMQAMFAYVAFFRWTISYMTRELRVIESPEGLRTTVETWLEKCWEALSNFDANLRRVEPGFHVDMEKDQVRLVTVSRVAEEVISPSRELLRESRLLVDACSDDDNRLLRMLIETHVTDLFNRVHAIEDSIGLR